ncbi:hypothetical protein [Flavobacterium hercynium]|uniref:Uncharacterized protein n=1 Tax=Flavobacterium hercynium TaxID=387094 RepID=A0A226HJF4_9FLAO|nr:hypothetical protein [Flavobacterium hercynium]OXA93796.1 hypothetical protein B0A66_05975 [Flavobacterium hercynium]SMP20358.1 hypothetical protein SAMN06265346_106168 [Flavobacterium hercynium]
MTNLIILSEIAIPKEFFTLQSMLTLTGATGVVFVVSNGLQRAFNFNPKWLALIIAEVLAIVGVITTKQYAISDFFVAIVNGFLIYSTAVGTNQITGKENQDQSLARGEVLPEGRKNLLPPKRAFTSKWF